MEIKTYLPVSSYTVPDNFKPNDPLNDKILNNFLGSHVLEFPATPKEIQERLVVLLISDIEMAKTEEEKQSLKKKLDEVLKLELLDIY